MRKNQLILFVGVTLFVTVLSFVGFRARTRATAQSVAKATQQTTTIALTATKADPESVSIPIGTFVQFNSRDGKTHAVELLSKAGSTQEIKLSSGEFEADEGYKVLINSVGIYTFTDTSNPAIHGQIVAFEPLSTAGK